MDLPSLAQELRVIRFGPIPMKRNESNEPHRLHGREASARISQGFMPFIPDLVGAFNYSLDARIA